MALQQSLHVKCAIPTKRLRFARSYYQKVASWGDSETYPKDELFEAGDFLAHQYEEVASLRETGGKSLVLFNASKNEMCTPRCHYTILYKYIKKDFRIAVNTKVITNDILFRVSVFITACPREKFTKEEIECLKNYIRCGGSVFVIAAEEGKTCNRNLSELTAEYGIGINDDGVVGTAYTKYFHPKECYVPDGVLNRGITKAAMKYTRNIKHQTLTYVYPHGATLDVHFPAAPVLSSGSMAYPVNQPICAFYPSEMEVNLTGRMVVLASAMFMADPYIDLENNNILRQVFFGFLTSNEVKIDICDAMNPEISDYNILPDLSTLAEMPLGCLQEEIEDLPSDFIKLFDGYLHSLHTSLLSTVLQAYTELKVEHEPLDLIKPNLEVPLPSKEPAVFPVFFSKLTPPPLELYDLDEELSSYATRLAQLANKHAEEDDKVLREGELEYYIRECAHIVDLPQGATWAPTARQVLGTLALHLGEYKKADLTLL